MICPFPAQDPPRVPSSFLNWSLLCAHIKPQGKHSGRQLKWVWGGSRPAQPSSLLSKRHTGSEGCGLALDSLCKGLASRRWDCGLGARSEQGLLPRQCGFEWEGRITLYRSRASSRHYCHEPPPPDPTGYAFELQLTCGALAQATFASL